MERVRLSPSEQRKLQPAFHGRNIGHLTNSRVPRVVLEVITAALAALEPPSSGRCVELVFVSHVCLQVLRLHGTRAFQHTWFLLLPVQVTVTAAN